MKMPRIIHVDGVLADYADLVEKEAAKGSRVGWLDLRSPVTVPQALFGSTIQGVFRAVEVGDQGTIAYKPRRGAPVLKDLIREYFLGCDLVLVRGVDSEHET